MITALSRVKSNWGWVISKIKWLYSEVTYNWNTDKQQALHPFSEITKPGKCGRVKPDPWMSSRVLCSRREEEWDRGLIGDCHWMFNVRWLHLAFPWKSGNNWVMLRMACCTQLLTEQQKLSFGWTGKMPERQVSPALCESRENGRLGSFIGEWVSTLHTALCAPTRDLWTSVLILHIY